MKKLKARILSFVMALAMTLTMVPVTASADTGDGTHDVIIYVGTYTDDGSKAAGRQQADLAMPDSHVGAFALTISDAEYDELYKFGTTSTNVASGNFIKTINGKTAFIISDTKLLDTCAREEFDALVTKYAARGNEIMNNSGYTSAEGTGYGYEEKLTTKVWFNEQKEVVAIRVEKVGNEREYGYTGPTSASGPSAGAADTTDEYGVFRNVLPRMIGLDMSTEKGVDDVLAVDTVTSATITSAAIKHSVVEAAGLKAPGEMNVSNFHDLYQAIAFIADEGTINITDDIAAGIDVGWDLGDDEVAACLNGDGIYDAVTMATIGQVKFDRKVTINGNNHTIHAATYAELQELYQDDAWTGLDSTFCFYVSGTDVTINDWTIDGAAYGYHQGGAIYVAMARGPQKIMSAYNRDAEKEDDDDEEEGGSTSGNSDKGGSTSGNTSNGSSTSGNTSNGSSTSGNSSKGGSTSGNTSNGSSTSGNTSNGSSTSGNSSKGGSTGGGTSGGRTGKGSKGSLTLNNVTIKNSTAAALNGVKEKNADGTMKTTCEETSNGGGAIVLENTGTLTATNCSFINNTTTATDVHKKCQAGIDHDSVYGEQGKKTQGGKGGAIFSKSGSATLTNCTFDGNSALFGGAIEADGGTLTVSGCTFTGSNNALYGGDDIYLTASSNYTFTDNSFSGSDGSTFKDLRKITVDFDDEAKIDGFWNISFTDSARYTVSSDTASKILSAYLEAHPSYSGGSSSETGTAAASTESGEVKTTKTETVKNQDGSTVDTTSTTFSNGDTATIIVEKSASGEIQSASVQLEAVGETDSRGKAVHTVTSKEIEAIIKSAGTEAVSLSISVKNAAGKEAYTVKLDLSVLSALSKVSSSLSKLTATADQAISLGVIKQNKSTGKYVLSAYKSASYSPETGLTTNFAASSAYDYVITSQDNYKTLANKIYKATALKKTSASVKTGKTALTALKSNNAAKSVKSVKYSSSDSKVAKVNADGKVTALKTGKAVIKAKVTYNNGATKTLTEKITVK